MKLFRTVALLNFLFFALNEDATFYRGKIIVILSFWVCHIVPVRFLSCISLLSIIIAMANTIETNWFLYIFQDTTEFMNLFEILLRETSLRIITNYKSHMLRLSISKVFWSIR